MNSKNIVVIYADSSLADFLKGEGHNVSSVSRADKALETLRKDPVDLVVMDLAVPSGIHYEGYPFSNQPPQGYRPMYGQIGLDLIARIHSTPLNQTTPILVLDSLGGVDHIRAKHEVEVMAVSADYLGGVLPGEVLMEKVNRLLQLN